MMISSRLHATCSTRLLRPSTAPSAVALNRHLIPQSLTITPQPVYNSSFNRICGGRFLAHCTSSSQVAEPATSDQDYSPLDDIELSKPAGAIIQYAVNFATVSETYETHSWMILLGLLKQENCRAAKILKDLGLDDLYGAWNEVLWALNASNGLEPRAYTPNIGFADRAFRILYGATNFARWGGRKKVQSEDLLMAIAAADVLAGLFPDLQLSFEHVRRAAAKHGCNYILPDDTEETLATVVAPEEDNFL